MIAEMWPRVGTSDRELDALTHSTIWLRDVRTYDALRRTVADRSRPAKVRIAAMVVLERYVNLHSAVWMDDLIPPDTIKRIPLIGASTTHTRVSNGSQPLGPVAPEVLSLFQTLASARDTEPREVWYAAAVLARRVGAP